MPYLGFFQKRQEDGLCALGRMAYSADILVDCDSVVNALIFDDDLIAELDRSVGAAGRNALLFELADLTEKIGDRLHFLIGAGDLKGARHEAHLLRNAIARVGAFRLIDCLVQVELYAGVQLTEAVFASKLAGAVEEFVQHARQVGGQSFASNSHASLAVVSSTL